MNRGAGIEIAPGAHAADPALPRGKTLPYAVDDGVVAEAERRLALASTAAVDDLLAVAWHLRQRDSQRAGALADRAAEALHAAGPSPGLHQAAQQDRLALLRAELAWLFAELPAAEQFAQAAAQGCEARDDHAGHCDAWCLLAYVALDQGDVDGAARRMRLAREQALRAADHQRVNWAEGALACWQVMANGPAGEQAWGAAVSRWAASDDPCCAMWAAEFNAKRAFQGNRFGPGIQAFARAAELATRIGQTRRAVIASTNVCAGYTTLGDHEAALEAVERALKLARPTGWPGPFGICLYMMGNSLRHLKQLDSARRVLDEALTVLAPLKGSRTHDGACLCSGELALEQEDFEAAQAAFAPLVKPQLLDHHPELVVIAQRGLADALLGLGQPKAAAAAASMSLQLAERHGIESCAHEALFVLASIHQRHSIETPAGVLPADAGLHFLTLAAERASRIEDYVVPFELWDELSAEQTRRGDMAAAHAAALRACAARDALQAEAAMNRAITLATRHETARAQAEREQMRLQAAADARRAEVLQATNDMLEQLGAIGQEITSGLDIDGVFGSIYRHLVALLDAQHLGIWLLGDPPDRLHLRYGIEGDRPMGPASIGLDSEVSNAVRCWREGSEILHLTDADQIDRSHMPGTVRTLTALFAPLCVRDRKIGVLSVQSERRGAYGQRERLIFRTVCAYSAVALDNAAAYQQLDRVRQELAASSQAERDARRLAEQATHQKSEFLANISHDLRTPLASLHGYLETLLVKADQLEVADRQRYLRTALSQSRHVGRLAGELLELARLESGAIELAVERFSLADLAQDVFQKLELAAKDRGQRLGDLIETGLPDVLADIGAIERVLTNLLDNAIRHAPSGSEIRLELRCSADRVCVRVMDNGPGISPAQRATLFSTPSTVLRAHRPGGGGLGLLVVQRLLQQHGSTIELVERPGCGPAFEFRLPRADDLDVAGTDPGSASGSGSKL